MRFLAVVLWTYVVLVVGCSLLLVLLGLRDSLRDRWTREAIAEERRRHALDIEERRQAHEESQRWLLQMHRYCLSQQEARHREEITRAVVEAMTTQAPHPLRDVA